MRLSGDLNERYFLAPTAVLRLPATATRSGLGATRDDGASLLRFLVDHRRDSPGEALALAEKEGQTEVKIATDLAVMGRLGEFGQAVIKRKADQLMGDFAECLARQVMTAR